MTTDLPCLRRLGVVAAFAALLLALLAVASAQQPLTAALGRRRSSTTQKQTYEVRNFRIGGKYDLQQPAGWANGGAGGITLESLGAKPARTAYMAVGTPKRNAKGEIVNAIVINSYYSGDATAMYSNWVAGQAGNAFSGGALVGPGLLFDTNRFYVIFVDALGLWGASKPSDGLGRKFPVYSYYDVVQLNYRLLRDQLKVGKVVLSDRRLDGRDPGLLLGPDAPGVRRAPSCRSAAPPPPTATARWRRGPSNSPRPRSNPTRCGSRPRATTTTCRRTSTRTRASSTTGRCCR